MTVPVAEIGYANGSAWSDSWYVDVSQEHVPELRWPLSVFVYDQMSTDAQVASVLRAVTLPIRRTAWRIDPAGARPEIVQMLAEDLGLPVKGQPVQEQPRRRTKDRFSWSEHLSTALLSLTYGHMFFEQLYRPDGSTGKHHIHKLAPRFPRTLTAIHVARDGGLVSIEQTGSKRPIPVNRLVAYAHERNGGSWLGQSLLRPAYGPWVLKQMAMRDEALMLRRNGMGIPVYEGAAGGDAEALQKGLEMAKAWRSGENSAAAVPGAPVGVAAGEGGRAKLRLLGVEGTLPDYDKPLRRYDEWIGRVALLHFLSLGGLNSTGSYALGDTFEQFFTQGLQAEAASIRDVVNQHVIEDWVDLNWGEGEPAPLIEFDEIGAHLSAGDIKMLLESGAIFADPVLEEFIRQKTNMPPKAPRQSPTPAPEEAA